MSSKWGIPRYLRKDADLEDALIKGAEFTFNSESDRKRFLNLEKVMLDVLDDPINFEEFKADPTSYFASRGLEVIDFEEDSQEFLVLKLVSEPKVQAAIERENVNEFLEALKNSPTLKDIPTLNNLFEEDDDDLSLVFPVAALAYVASAIAAWIAISHHIFVTVAIKLKVGVESWVDTAFDVYTAFDVTGGPRVPGEPLPPMPTNPTPNPQPSPDPDPSPDPGPTPDPDPDPAPDPIPIPGPIPWPEPEPDPEPVPTPEPEPVPTPDPEPVPVPEPEPVPVPDPDPSPLPPLGRNVGDLELNIDPKRHGIIFQPTPQTLPSVPKTLNKLNSFEKHSKYMAFYFAYRDSFISKSLNMLGKENFSQTVFEKLFDAYEKDILSTIQKQNKQTDND